MRPEERGYPGEIGRFAGDAHIQRAQAFAEQHGAGAVYDPTYSYRGVRPCVIVFGASADIPADGRILADCRPHNVRYNVEIDGIGSACISYEAAKVGATHCRLVGCGYAAGHEGEQDYRVCVYAIPNPNGWEVLVANTNGDPVWEEPDPGAFADFASECGIEL